MIWLVNLKVSSTNKVMSGFYSKFGYALAAVKLVYRDLDSKGDVFEKALEKPDGTQNGDMDVWLFPAVDTHPMAVAEIRGYPVDKKLEDLK